MEHRRRGADFSHLLETLDSDATDCGTALESEARESRCSSEGNAASNGIRETYDGDIRIKSKTSTGSQETSDCGSFKSTIVAGYAVDCDSQGTSESSYQTARTESAAGGARLSSASLDSRQPVEAPSVMNKTISLQQFSPQPELDLSQTTARSSGEMNRNIVSEKSSDDDDAAGSSSRDTNYNIKRGVRASPPRTNEYCRGLQSPRHRFRPSTPRVSSAERQNTTSSLLASLDRALDSPGDAAAKSQRNALRRLSQEFMCAPRAFTDRLVTIIDESETGLGAVADDSGVNLSRMTREFRKMCRYIQDESMPEMAPSLCADSIVGSRFAEFAAPARPETIVESPPESPPTSDCRDTPQYRQPDSQDRKKSYRKTPLNIFRNAHRADRGVASPGSPNSTREFESLEKYCEGLPSSPSSPSRSCTRMAPPPLIRRAILTAEDDAAQDTRDALRKRSEELLRSLDDTENREFATFDSHQGRGDAAATDAPSSDARANLANRGDAAATDAPSSVARANRGDAAATDAPSSVARANIANRDDAVEADRLRVCAEYVDLVDDDGDDGDEDGEDGDDDDEDDDDENAIVLSQSLMVEKELQRQRCFETALLMQEIAEDAKKTNEPYPKALERHGIDPDAAFVETMQSCLAYRDCISGLHRTQPKRRDGSSVDSGIDTRSFGRTLLTSGKKSVNEARISQKSAMHSRIAGNARQGGISAARSIVKSPVGATRRTDRKTASARNLHREATSQTQKSRAAGTPRKNDVFLRPAARSTTLSRSPSRLKRSPTLSVAPRIRALLKTPEKTRPRVLCEKSPAPEIVVALATPANSIGWSSSKDREKLGSNLRKTPNTISRGAASPSSKSSTAATPTPSPRRLVTPISTPLGARNTGSAKVLLTPSVNSTPITRNPSCASTPKSTSGRAETRRRSTATVKTARSPCRRYFVTPGRKTPAERPRKATKYFTMDNDLQLERSRPIMKSLHAPGLYRMGYETVVSPVSMYIRGTDVNLIHNNHERKNEMMLTPTKVAEAKEKLKFELAAKSSPRKSPWTKYSPYRDDEDSGTDDNDENEEEPGFALPKAKYHQAAQVHTVDENPKAPLGPRTRGLVQSMMDRIVIRHEGKRLGKYEDCEQPESCTDSATDMSIHVIKPAVMTNFIERNRKKY